MSYTKTTWVDGDTISATRLNKIENGIDDAINGDIGVVTITYSIDGAIETYTLNKNYNQILQMWNNCSMILVKETYYESLNDTTGQECVVGFVAKIFSGSGGNEVTVRFIDGSSNIYSASTTTGALSYIINNEPMY